jgi:hypothetical protein
MSDRTGTHHIQINVYDALSQIMVARYGRCRIAVFPKNTFPILSFVVFLSGAAGNQQK